ncbi:MAG TPA: hypothetical protein DDZ51_30535 [Planctomycetaceae bacterium]|nr:hypothetical protein [Planctomycetaceae bacterium]
MWTIDEAEQALERTFPNLSVIIADGEVDYLVGTIEDPEESIVASFQLLLDSSGQVVTEIRIAAGQTYCGHGQPSSPRETVSHFVPIQITRHGGIGAVWGLVGDYEVCISSEQIEIRKT